MLYSCCSNYPDIFYFFDRLFVVIFGVFSRYIGMEYLSDIVSNIVEKLTQKIKLLRLLRTKKIWLTDLATYGGYFLL